jgi:acetyl-CoA acetyltransferase
MAAGFPHTVPVQVINRWCSSGLMAVTDISNKVRTGQIDIGLAVGMESMSSKYVSLVAGKKRSETFRQPGLRLEASQ